MIRRPSLHSLQLSFLVSCSVSFRNSSLLDFVIFVSWIKNLKVMILHLVYASLHNFFFNNIKSEISQDPITLIFHCRYYLLVSLIWFALTEKFAKQMFFLNLTNSRTIKTMFSIFDNGENPIVITTPEGYVLFFNKSFVKFSNGMPDNIK